MQQQPIAYYFDNKTPIIKDTMSFKIAAQIKDCLHAGHSSTSIDRYIGKERGTIMFWEQHDLFERFLDKKWKATYKNLCAHKDLLARLMILEQVTDYEIRERGRALLWLKYYEPEWFQALVDRGVDLTDNNGSNLIWYIVPPESLSIFIANGVDVNYFQSGQSVIERYANSKINKADKMRCIKILISAGADVQPLYDALYKRRTILHLNDVVQMLTENGFTVDLEKTLVYRLHHNLIPYEELANIFYGNPRKHLYVYYERYPTYEKMLTAAKETVEGLLGDMERTMAKMHTIAAETRKTLDSVFNTDVSYLITKTLYSYATY